MFSDHMKKVNRFPQVGLLILAGGLVIVCQLVAMAMVADRQVHRAGVRDLQRVAQQLALADCIQRSTGPTRHGCILQSQVESSIGDVSLALSLPSPTSEPNFAVREVVMADGGVTSENAQLLRVRVSLPR